MQEHWVKFFTNNKLSEPPRRPLRPRKMNLLGQRHREGRGVSM